MTFSEGSDFEHRSAKVNGIELHYVVAGDESADPVVLLHGFPQSWIMWREILPTLARKYFVVAADLRGYGDSEKPPAEAGHDQRTKAADIRALIEDLGLREVVIVGHDRGARVTRRYALDHPETLKGIALLDILPAEYIYDELTAAEVYERFWHWIFQIVEDLPEQLISGNEETYLRRFFERAPGLLEKLESDGAYDEYLRVFSQPGAVAAAMNDYRATFNVDVPRYRAERESGAKIPVPTLLLWGERGNLRGFPVEDVWREVVSEIDGAFKIPDCGHYLPEEQPEIVLEHLLPFVERHHSGQ